MSDIISSTERSALIEQLQAGYDWTAARLASIRPEHLDRPTPCSDFDLGQLLVHLNDSVARFVTAVGGNVPPDAGTGPVDRFASLPSASVAAWADADLTATFELPIGTLPAPLVAQINLAEVVVHGWDVSRATGEGADVPADLADAVTQFGHMILTDDNRAPAFGPAQPGGTTPSDRMAAFYGRQV